jgi:hypothetical protein
MNDHLPRSMPYEQAVRAMLADAGRSAKGKKSAQEYDDQQAVDSYVVKYWTQYLSEAEKRWYNCAIRLAKAHYQADTPWGQQVLAEWERNADEELRVALAEGFAPLEERLWQEVLAGFQSGILIVNRCPGCHRVVRTPRARQCFWCRNDWHE